MAKTIKMSATPWRLTPDTYAAIGEVAVLWSQFETTLTAALTRLLKTDTGRFLAVSSNMNTSQQIDSALTLCKMTLAPEKGAPLEKALTLGRQMSRERNKIIHGSWLQTAKPHISMRITTRAYGEPIEERALCTHKSLRNFGKQVHELAEQMTEAMVHAGLLEGNVPGEPVEFTIDMWISVTTLSIVSCEYSRSLREALNNPSNR
jgi:hypothetical protein